MSHPLPEPGAFVTDAVTRIVEYLDFFRAEVRRKATGLDAEALQRPVVPSGWTVLGLVEHLAHMERRWVVWGFLGENVPDPHGDRDTDDRWVTDRPLEQILADLDDVGRRTREVASTRDVLETAASGGKWTSGDERPTLLAILFHVLQEHARHAGHLDIARELIDGLTGED